MAPDSSCAATALEMYALTEAARCDLTWARTLATIAVSRVMVIFSFDMLFSYPEEPLVATDSVQPNVELEFPATLASTLQAPHVESSEGTSMRPNDSFSVRVAMPQT
jgi:hypothetical protein